jgi:glucose-6-phosphate 1-dehydrogenase
MALVHKIDQPFIITIFGASGDLAKLLLAPAIYSLFEQGRLPKEFAIVGFARTKKTSEEFRQEFKAAVEKGSESGTKMLPELLEHIEYVSGDYSSSAAYASYYEFLKQKKFFSKALHVAYFSVPSSTYKDIIDNLAKAFDGDHSKMRLILEKPFGIDRKSAEDIFHFASQHFSEEQFYLLDHYLGKPAVRSIMHLRESNRIFSHMMRGYEIANIQITASEDMGVKERANYFEQVGTIRDFVQSHMLQILSLVTMSLPIDKSARSLQREKHTVLSAIECPCDPGNIVIGQYQGYRKEKNVASDSRVETFAALRLFIDRLDWHGVPIYMRTGKKLTKKQTYVMVELKKFPFQDAAEPPNRLIFELFPFEELKITLLNKQEDPAVLQEITATQSVACNVEDKCLPPGHAPLLLDALRGDKKYFLSFPEVLAAWEIIDEVTTLITQGKIKLEAYPDGSRGPKSQDDLPKKDGFSWYELP